MSKMTLGIDISKLKFDVTLLLPSNKIKNKKFENNKTGFTELSDWLTFQNVNELHICMEATGSYGEALATFLFNAGYTVSVVNPAQIKGFSQSALSRVKTDRSDAALIARFCQAIRPPAWQPTPKPIQELQAWVRRLEDLQNILQQEKNRSQVVPEYIKPSVEKIISKINEEMTEVKKKIQSHISQHPDLRNKEMLLKTIPGIGEATIMQILAFIGHPEKFHSAKQLAAFIGLNPAPYQSGSSVRGKTRLSKVGNAQLRKAFYMPAIVAKRFNPVVKAFCDRLKMAGKSTMSIIGAAMRKLVHIVYGVLKSQKSFDVALAI